MGTSSTPNKRAPSHILSPRHWLKMLRANAVSHPAKMIQLESRRNRTDLFFISPSVGSHMSMVVPKSPVATYIQGGGPQPAAISLGYLRPKSLMNIFLRANYYQGGASFSRPKKTMVMGFTKHSEPRHRQPSTALDLAGRRWTKFSRWIPLPFYDSWVAVSPPTRIVLRAQSSTNRCLATILDRTESHPEYLHPTEGV